MYYVSAQGVDERMINVHYYIMCLDLVLAVSFVSGCFLISLLVVCTLGKEPDDCMLN